MKVKKTAPGNLCGYHAPALWQTSPKSDQLVYHLFTRSSNFCAMVRLTQNWHSHDEQGDFPMAWTTPKTWVNNEPLTASDLNTHLRDNLNALKAPPAAQYTLDESSNYTTTGSSFVNIDGTKLSLTIVTSGGDVLIGFTGSVNPGGFITYFDVEMDGTRIGGNDGILAVASSNVTPIPLVYLKTGVSAGSHMFKLQWKTSGGTTTLYAGAGTASYDLHPQFWVREVS